MRVVLSILILLCYMTVQIREAARQMGEKAFKERLKQIQMSEYDAEVYNRFYSSVRKHIQSLRVVLDSLQAKGINTELPKLSGSVGWNWYSSKNVADVQSYPIFAIELSI